jgi:hypothetical protein
MAVGQAEVDQAKVDEFMGWRPEPGRQRLAVVSEMLELAMAAADREVLAQARLLRATALVELGDPAGRTELEAYCHLAGELGHARGRYGALSRRAALELLDGRIADADATSHHAAALGAEIGEPDAVAVLATQQWELARFREGGRTWYGSSTLGRTAPGWPPFRALALADAGDHAGAAAAPAALATSANGPARRSRPGSGRPSAGSNRPTPTSAATCARPSPRARRAPTPRRPRWTGSCEVSARTRAGCRPWSRPPPDPR